MQLDRRRFLQVYALGVAAAIVYPACESSDRRTAQVDKPRLLDMLGADRVRAIGNRYVASTPNEKTVDALRSAISKSRSQSRVPLMPRTIDDQIREDFTSGHTVLVDGWVLSVTEARQAALFALSA
ncbi:MAG TPA: hypothetical protein VJ852_07860 [Gemmatimonadaceae bacterium]|nr:hypothetical protein [Gemmatimonadaceae bacterium]